MRLSASEPALSRTNTAALDAPATPAVAPAPAVHQDRAFAESDFLKLLTSTLQDQCVKDEGELELRLTQPWKSLTVPDQPLKLRVLDMPTMGVTPMFIIRFELLAGDQSLGSFQTGVQAHVWREIWVARSPLQRGDPVSEDTVEKERRDMLLLHEPLADYLPGDTSLEIAQSLQTGSPLLARSIRLRPVIHRGQIADALVRDGTLSVTLKVEALEDGAPGQVIRIRNPQSRRDLRGTVLNGQTILVPL